MQLPGIPDVLPSPDQVIGPIRHVVSSGLRSILSGDPDGQPDWVLAIGNGEDEGYFGPGSATWAVHGSLPTLVGGVRALLMQALHPAALAGVIEHSRIGEDPLGRLAGTAQWVTVTTFGDKKAAKKECARVRRLHRRVKGVYETGNGPAPYSASDPDLLRWVHVAFTDSFLATYRVWGTGIPGGEDAYVREWAKAGALVGVTDPPRSVAELADQIRSYDGVLRSDDATAAAVKFIRDAPLPLAARPGYLVLLAGAVATLSEQHRQMLGLPRVPLTVARPVVWAALRGLGLALDSQSPSQRQAQRRVERLMSESGQRSD